MNKYFTHLLKVFASICLIYFLLSKIEIGEVFLIIKKVNFYYFIAGFLVFFACWIVNSKKWGVLLASLGFKEKTLKLFKLNLISIFYSSVLPGGPLTGEAIKCYKITKDTESKGKLVLSVLMDRLTGLMAIILLGLVGIFFSTIEIETAKKLKLFFLLLSFGGLFFLILYLSGLLKYIHNKIGKFQNKFSTCIQRVINVFVAYQGAYGTMIVSILYGILFQFLNTLSVYLVAVSVGIEISIFDLFWINTLISIMLVAPVTIMGLGIREGGFVYFLSLLYIPNTSALALSLLVSLAYLLVGMSGGLIEFYESIKTKNKTA